MYETTVNYNFRLIGHSIYRKQITFSFKTLTIIERLLISDSARGARHLNMVWFEHAMKIEWRDKILNCTLLGSSRSSHSDS